MEIWQNWYFLGLNFHLLFPEYLPLETALFAYPATQATLT